jgi:VanZ family protein
MSRPAKARLLWGALILWACVILFVSSLTPQELPEAAFLFWDKVNHFVAYAAGGWLAASALRASGPQTLTPGRSGGDVDDWVADVLGASAGALLTLPTLPRWNLR